MEKRINFGDFNHLVAKKTDGKEPSIFTMENILKEIELANLIYHLSNLQEKNVFLQFVWTEKKEGKERRCK